MLQNKYIAFCLSRTLWLSFTNTCSYDFLSHPTDKYLFKVKSINTILICWLWSKSTIKTSERCHTAFIFNFEHIQQINLILLLLPLNMYCSVRHRIKSTKQRQCTFSNRAVALKHVHVIWVSQHGLNNTQTIESNVHMIVVNWL